jgi:hypothetical protein
VLNLGLIRIADEAFVNVITYIRKRLRYGCDMGASQGSASHKAIKGALQINLHFVLLRVHSDLLTVFRKSVKAPSPKCGFSFIR